MDISKYDWNLYKARLPIWREALEEAGLDPDDYDFD